MSLCHRLAASLVTWLRTWTDPMPDTSRFGTLYIHQATLPASGVTDALVEVGGVIYRWDGAAWEAVTGGSSPTSSRTLWVQAADSSPVANTDAATQFDQNVTLAADVAAAGDAIEGEFGGTFEVAADSSLALAGYLNDVASLVSVADPTLAAAGFASGRWAVKYKITFPSTGLQRVETTFSISYTATASLYEVKQQVTTLAVNPAASLKLGAGVAWGVANAGNTITQTYGTVSISKS